MSTERILWLYRLTFVSLIIVASVQTIMTAPGAGHQYHVVALATAEIAGALALAWRPMQLVGAGMLLLVFAAAEILSIESGEWPTRFVIYAASTLLIVLLDARRPR